MNNVTKLLKESTYCLDIKQYFQQGHYGVEESVMELLDYLSVSCQEPRSVKNDAIMMFLHS